MKRLSTWDTYVQEASKKGDRDIELPLTDDEVFVIPYPTRRQAREIAQAQRVGDLDKLLAALLGEEAGKRVSDLAEDQPVYVLDEFLLDVMRKFGMIPEEADLEEAEKVVGIVNGAEVATNGKPRTRGKATTRTSKTPSKTPSKRSSAVSS